jgi:hypothetical protein
MSFHVGQKVVCVKGFASDPRAHLVAHLPRKGAIYHVRRNSGGFLSLAEIVNPPVANRGVAHFCGSHFRPVVERSTEAGVAKLRQILTDHKAPVKAVARARS